MSDSLSVDPAELRASAAELKQQADETEQMLREMRAIVANEGRCWGDDELGETFAKSYEPDSERGLEGLEDLVAELRAMSANLAKSAEEFEQRDRGGGQQVRGSDPLTRDGAMPPASNPFAAPAMQPAEDPYTAGDSTQRPSAAERPEDRPGPRPESTNSPGAGPGADSGRNADPGAAPQQSPGSSNDPSDTDSPDTGAPDDQAGHEVPDTTSQAPPTAGDPARQQNSRAGKQPNAPSTPDGRSSAGRAAAESPWSQNRSGTPWSRPSAAPPAAANDVPPRVSPPQAPHRPPGGKKTDDPPRDRPDRRSKPRVAPPRTTKPTDAEAMRIAREMAARHGLSIVGFESAGIDVSTVQDIADAVDAVLDRYPTVLRGIEITEVASTLSAVENRSVAATSKIPAPWIVLARTAAVNPRLLADKRPATAPDAPPHRPMYTTMLRELGAAVDLTGGLRARGEAQRALITEYLRVNGAQGETLAQVVGGYKRWRAQLGDGCFEQGVFVPARALAEAFAAVESGGGEASGPAKVLHRTLVMMSQAPVRPGSRTPTPTRAGRLPDAPAHPPQSEVRPSHQQ
ncbi:WXG100 family type VII secretion target [Nocardia wallacei]|uniref:WXG100 family type VII secretion target n=1 Tax=Nocardia wallacei TaxID=480035 RepID=UPI002454A841|nr:WXG100 family type VII secretion target [Nocardia wallacei]